MIVNAMARTVKATVTKSGQLGGHAWWSTLGV